MDFLMKYASGVIMDEEPAGGVSAKTSPFFVPHDLFPDELKELNRIVDKGSPDEVVGSSRGSWSVGYGASGSSGKLDTEDVK